MNSKPINNDTDYRVAPKETEALLAAELSTAEGEKLDILTTLIETYECKHFRLIYPIPLKPLSLKWNGKV